MTDVFYFDVKESDLKELRTAAKNLSKFYSSPFESDDDLVIKLHFGERNSDTHLNPDFVEEIYRNVKGNVEDCILTDCNVLYKGERSKGDTHKELAQDNGFDFAPVVIADGIRGEEEVVLNIDEKHFGEVKVGGKLTDYDSILAVSHFTGHGANAIGGALKNVGMGLGSKAGKLAMHSAFNLMVDTDLCTACRNCIKHCPEETIEIVDGIAKIDQEECIGCGRCIAECSTGAVKIPWGGASSQELQERIVEYALGIIENWKMYYVNVLVDITEGCDCLNRKQDKMIEDVGVLVSCDPVAIDQASLDLVGKEKFEKRGLDPEIQIKYAEELGLGSRDYELKKV